MPVSDPVDLAVSVIAAAIGEPARTRILHSLLDGRARTSTELAMVAGVSPSTASVHLSRLQSTNLLKVVLQGKHRYYSLAGRSVARALEGLSVLAGCSPVPFASSTPTVLREARTCYDHIAGNVGVALHGRFQQLGWLKATRGIRETYHLTTAGFGGFTALGVDVEKTMLLRRRFAYPCLDWSERQPHVAGALGSALLDLVLRKRWMSQDGESRALRWTRGGKGELEARIGPLS